jgi:hypothetical protein
VLERNGLREAAVERVAQLLICVRVMSSRVDALNAFTF